MTKRYLYAYYDEDYLGDKLMKIDFTTIRKGFQIVATAIAAFEELFDVAEPNSVTTSTTTTTPAEVPPASPSPAQ